MIGCEGMYFNISDTGNESEEINENLFQSNFFKGQRDVEREID